MRMKITEFVERYIEEKENGAFPRTYPALEHSIDGKVYQ